MHKSEYVSGASLLRSTLVVMLKVQMRISAKTRIRITEFLVVLVTLNFKQYSTGTYQVSVLNFTN